MLKFSVKILFNSRFRILAFDGGLLSFRDFKFSQSDPNKNDLYILITNPKNIQFKALKNREPLHRMRTSTHIRVLIFSKNPVLSVKVLIDDVNVGQAKRASPDGPLYSLEWNPYQYKTGVHKIKVVVEVITFFYLQRWKFFSRFF